MLSVAFSAMNKDAWSRCPSTTNAVERKNKDCKSDTPNCLKAAMIKVYKIDKVACLKHIAAEDGTSLSYRSKTEQARRETARRKQKQRMGSIPDKTAEYGPPDRPSNFLSTSGSRKRKNTSSTDNPPTKKAIPHVSSYTSTNDFTPNSHPEVLGKSVRMKFDDEHGKGELYDGIICPYNGMTRKYGVYFPCDGETIDTDLEDKDMEICN